MTRQEYDDYVAAFERNTAGLEALSSGPCPGCEACGLPKDCTEEERELAGEASFSWTPCEFCQRPLGGDREPAHAIIPVNGSVVGADILHFAICVDCVYFIEYGQLDDMTMLGLEEESETC